MSCLRVRCKLFHIFALPSLTSALRPTIVCSFHVFLNVNLKIFCTRRGWSSIVGSLICTSNFCISSDRLSELGHFDQQCNTLICFRHGHHASRQFPMICPQLQWNSDDVALDTRSLLSCSNIFAVLVPRPHNVVNFRHMRASSTVGANFLANLFLSGSISVRSTFRAGQWRCKFLCTACHSCSATSLDWVHLGDVAAEAPSSLHHPPYQVACTGSSFAPSALLGSVASVPLQSSGFSEFSEISGLAGSDHGWRPPRSDMRQRHRTNLVSFRLHVADVVFSARNKATVVLSTSYILLQKCCIRGHVEQRTPQIP